jgi:hypothetical protein
VLSESLQAVLGHHATSLGVVLGAPLILGPLEVEAPDLPGLLQNPTSLGDNLLTDPVPGDERYVVSQFLSSSTEFRGWGDEEQDGSKLDLPLGLR